MRVSYSIWPVYSQFQLDNSTITWPKDLNTSHLLHLKNSTGDTDSIWTLFSHTGVYVMAIGSLIQQVWEYFAVISFDVDLPD